MGTKKVKSKRPQSVRSDAVQNLNRLVRLVGEKVSEGTVEQRFMSDCGEVQLELRLAVPRHTAAEGRALLRRNVARWIRELSAVSR